MKKRKLMSIIIVAVLVGITILTVYRTFISDQLIALRALNNTVKDSHLAKDFKIYDAMKDGNYTVSVSAKNPKVTFNVSYSSDRSAKKQSLSGDFDYDSLRSDFQCMLDEQNLLLSAPAISDQILAYNYTKEKNGVIEKYLKEKGIPLDEIDETLEKLQSSEKETASMEAFSSDMKVFLKKLRFDRIDTKECNVYGVEQKCSGYGIDLNQDLIDEWQEIWQKDMGGYMMLAKVFGYEPQFSENFTLDQICLYVYKNQIAEIACRQKDGSKITMALLGGSVPFEIVHITDTNKGQETIVETEDYSNSNEMTIKIRAYQPEKETKGTTAVISVSDYADLCELAETDAIDLGNVTIKQWAGIVADFEKWKIKAQLKKTFF